MPQLQAKFSYSSTSIQDIDFYDPCSRKSSFFMNIKPDALIIGPMKAGTTWVYDYFTHRGDICLPNQVKETFFFDRYWQRGIDWYAGHFRHCADKKKQRCVEVGPSYFHHPQVPGRISQALGDIPLVVTLRDPIRRAWSHYLHLQRYGYTKLSLREATQEFPEILTASHYTNCLAGWYEFFSPETIYFVWQELLAHSPEGYAHTLCDALSVEYRPVPKSLLSPSYESGQPRSRLVARLGNRTSYVLRDLGLYKLVKFAKTMGLHGLFFGKPGTAKDMQPTGEDLSWLQDQLSDAVPPEAEEARRVQFSKYQKSRSS